MPSIKAEILQHGLVWYRSKSRPAIEPFSGAYRGAVIGTCERCSFKVPEPYFCFAAWLEAASKRLHSNVLVVALAARLARMAWSMLAKGRDYDANLLGRTA